MGAAVSSKPPYRCSEVLASALGSVAVSCLTAPLASARWWILDAAFRRTVASQKAVSTDVKDQSAPPFSGETPRIIPYPVTKCKQKVYIDHCLAPCRCLQDVCPVGRAFFPDALNKSPRCPEGVGAHLRACRCAPFVWQVRTYAPQGSGTLLAYIAALMEHGQAKPPQTHRLGISEKMQPVPCAAPG